MIHADAPTSVLPMKIGVRQRQPQPPPSTATQSAKQGTQEAFTSPSPPQGRMWIYCKSKLVFPSDSSDSRPRYGGDWGGTGWTVLQSGFLPPKNSTSRESEISWSKLLTGLKELGLCGCAEGRKRRGIPTSHRESLFRWRCQTSGQTGLRGPGSPLGRPGKSWPWWASTPALCRTSQDLESRVASR